MDIDKASQGGFPQQEADDDEVTTGTTLGTTVGTTTGTTTGDGHPPRVND